jgi:hypothetical protein
MSRIRSQTEHRRYFIGGSDTRIIMGNDEAALLRLWQEKRGEIEPEDLSGNLIVQLGLVTEELNRRWYEANTGQVITDIQSRLFHPALRWMAATIDGRAVLAHASGEWIASDWPVCAISETASPHRMGAALTYARRYGLFTLVGIAGEDDLDAPDLITPTMPDPTTARSKPKSRLDGGPRYPRQQTRRPMVSKASGPVLEPIASAALRDKLIAELKELNSSDEAATCGLIALLAQRTGLMPETPSGSSWASS